MIPSFTSAKVRSLGPDDLRAASHAFDSALATLGGDVGDPGSVRRELARFIMEGSFDGERNADRLCAGALEHARLFVRK